MNIRQIEEMYNSGMTLRQISTALDIAHYKLYNFVNKNNLNRRRPGRQLKYLNFTECGLLSDISRVGSTNNFKCTCKCGKETIQPYTRLNNAFIKGQNIGCKECKGARISDSKWQGYNHVSMDFYTSLCKSAAARNYTITVSIQQLSDLFDAQDQKCALSGVDIHLSKSTTRGRSTASLDRIDSSGNYTLDNVQWVHKDVNIMKNKYSQEYFIDLCRSIANLHPE